MMTRLQETQVHLPQDFQDEFQLFLLEAGFDNPDPQALLMDLASLSIEVFPNEIAWLIKFLGRVEQANKMAA